MLRAAILVPGLLAACSPPDLGHCDVQCGSGGLCPAGATCASDGFCHRSTDQPLCRIDSDASSEVDDDDAATGDAGPIDASPSVTIGYTAPFLAAGGISPDNLTGFAVTVAETSQLESFGLYMHAANQGNVMMALYDSLGTGEPGALVAWTMPFGDSAGEHRQPPMNATALSPGQYWLFTATAQRNDVGCDKTRTITGRYRAWTFASGLPASFGTASVWSNMHPVNYYLVLR